MEAVSREPLRRKVLGWARDLGVLVGVWAVVHIVQTRELHLPNAAPIQNLQNEIVDVSGPHAMHFEASWCGVCRAEASNVQAFARHQHVVVVVSQSGSAAEVATFATSQGLDPSLVVADPDGTIASRYGVRSFPTTFFVRGSGDMAAVEVGYTTLAGMWVRMAWASLF